MQCGEYGTSYYQGIRQEEHFEEYMALQKESEERE